MRVLCAFVLAAFLWVLSLALGGDGAMALAQFIRPSSVSEPPLVLEAAFVCGMFDGKFGCKSAPGGVDHGKNATPGIPSATPDASPGVTGDTTNPAAATYGAGNAGQGSQSGFEEKETAKPGEHSCPPGYRVLAVRPSLVIASRRGERLRLTRPANTEWWARRPTTATARRIQNCWAAIAFITARRVGADSPPTPSLNLAKEPTRSSLAKRVKMD
jgi:hypothetical protein